MARRTAAASNLALPFRFHPAQVNASGRAAARREVILAPDLQPLSFEELPLGGEWTTRRRTISEADIALFSGITADFSPHALGTDHSGGRFAPPALVAAAAIGLGSIDTPMADVFEWGWASWKFQRAVRAGDTITARWALTQKRPPQPGSSTGIVVWRVDVLNGDGTLCAEGEVGASVRRKGGPQTKAPAGAGVAASGPSRSRSRRRRRGAQTSTAEAAQPAAEPLAAPTAAPAQGAPGDRPASRGRRRRRRSSGAHKNGEGAALESSTQPAVEVSVAPAPQAVQTNPLSRVIKRLRGS